MAKDIIKDRYNQATVKFTPPNRVVQILIQGGVAHLASVVEGVTVEIIDYDNAGPDKDEEGRPCSIEVQEG